MAHQLSDFPRPNPAPQVRQAGRSWDDGDADVSAEGSSQQLTREQAQALRARHPTVSPWRVIAMQVAVGLVVALICWAVTGQGGVAWSALYGAATVVVPGALMARGMTSRLTSMSPGVSAVSFMSWEFVKMGVSVAMLALAFRVVHPLSWPALLVGLVACIKVYWLALLWRGR